MFICIRYRHDKRFITDITYNQFVCTFSCFQFKCAVYIGSRALLGPFPINIRPDDRLVVIIKHMPFYFLRLGKNCAESQYYNKIELFQHYFIF